MIKKIAEVEKDWTLDFCSLFADKTLFFFFLKEKGGGVERVIVKSTCTDGKESTV